MSTTSKIQGPTLSLAIFVLLSGIMFLTGGANALEFRKCNYKMMVRGSGLADTEVVGVRFWVWSRQSSASGAWASIGGRAKVCSGELVKADYNTVPTQCNPYSNNLHNGRTKGFGVTGLNTTRVRTRIKKTICENHKRSNADVRTVFDTRKIDGFSVYVRHIGSTTGACRSQTSLPTRYLTIHCRKKGGDKTFEWFYSRN